MRRMVITLAAACWAVAVSAFQVAPPRDVRKEPPGTGTISGVVLADDGSGKPLRRASVRIAGDPLLTQRMVITDGNGRFAFNGLAAGDYTVTAQRNNYMSMSVGSRRPGGTGAPVVLASGQRLTDIVLKLPKFAAISGTVFDQIGEPAPNVWVEALRYSMRSGARLLSNVYGAPTSTDDRGMFRLGGLETGEYYLAAGPTSATVDLQMLSASDVDRALQIRQPGTSTAAGDAGSVVPRRRVSFASVYYPGSVDLAGASPIALKLGEERTGADIRLQLVPTARLEGTVTAPDGQPVAGAQIVATAVTEAYTMALFSADRIGSVRSDAQGRFALPSLAPARYVLTARGDVPSSAEPGAARVPMWALEQYTVSGADQRIALAMQPGMTVSGRIAFDGTTLARPSAATTVRVTLSPAQTINGVSLGVTAATSGPDGTFTISGVAPGTYRVTATTPASPSGWVLRSATMPGLDTTDVLDVPFDVRAGQNIEGAVVTYSDRPAELSGALLAPTGTPTSDYFILVFSADRKSWAPYGRRVVMVRPSTAGRYLVRNLPAGDYRVVAVTDLEQGAQFDPAFLTGLMAASVPVTIVEGDKKVVDLRLTGG